MTGGGNFPIVRELSAPASAEPLSGIGGPSGVPRSVAPPGAVSKLLLVRHGETMWNKDGRIQGQLDIELNEVGRGQARAVAQALQRLGIADSVDAVVSSDLLRASQTADIIAESCPRAWREKDERLREINFGALQGNFSKEKETKAMREQVIGSWCRGKFDAGYPGGEDGTALISRGLRALRHAADLGSVVVVVAHGGLIKWSAVGLAVSARCADTSPRSGAELFEADDFAELQQVMESDEVQELLRSPVKNCCCSGVFFDHATGNFRKEARWFEDIVGDAAAKEDTG